MNTSTAPGYTTPTPPPSWTLPAPRRPRAVRPRRARSALRWVGVLAVLAALASFGLRVIG